MKQWYTIKMWLLVMYCKIFQPIAQAVPRLKYFHNDKFVTLNPSTSSPTNRSTTTPASFLSRKGQRDPR